MLKLLLYLVFITLSLGQFAAISKQGEANIYLFDIFTGLFSVYGLFYYFSVKKRFLTPKYLILFVLFTLFALLSLAANLYKHNSSETLVAGFYLIRWVSYLLSGFVIFNMLKHGDLDRGHLFNLVIWSGVFISLAGFAQLVLLPDFETLSPVLGWDPHKNRLASTFFDPNFTGAYLSICLAILFERFYTDMKGFTAFKLKELLAQKQTIFLLLIFVAAFLTFSRSTWFFLGVIVFIYGLFKSKALLFLAILVVFSAYFAVPRIQTRIAGITDPADSASFRYESWKDTSEMVQDNLLLGVGFNYMRYAKRDYGFLGPDKFLIHSGAGSDSSLLFVLATTGVFGFFTFLAAFFFPIIDQFVSRKKNWVLLVAVLTGLLAESQFINSLFYPQVLFLWVLLFASFSSSRSISGT